MFNQFTLVTLLIVALQICVASSSINVPNTLIHSPINRRQLHKRSSSSSSNEEDGGTCYEDCLSEVYNGIRSADWNGRKCLKWNKKNNKYSKLKSNFCTMKDAIGKGAWCYVPKYWPYYWNYCKIPRCNSKTKFIGCVRNIHVFLTSQSITGNWSSPSEVSSNNNLVGYLILLHNNEGECLQYIIQAEVKEEHKFSITVKNFYISCTKRNKNLNVNNKFQFDNLYQNAQYSVYIIPIIDTENVGSVKNITITTKLPVPESVKNVQLSEQGQKKLTFKWDTNKQNKYYGAASYYLVYLSTQLNIHSDRNITESSITYDYLKECTKYCLSISAGNSAGLSGVNDKFCAVTTCPVSVNKVKYGYGNSKIVSWQYMESDNVPKQYKVEYRPQGNSVSYKTIRTNDTNLVLTNLIPNTMYKLRVSAIGNADKFPSVSNFTNMYTGNSKISVTDFNHHFDSSGKQLLIAWQLKDEDVGAVLMFYLEVTNSSGYCVSTFMNKNSTSRIPSTHITKDINNNNNNNNCNVTSQTKVYGNVNKITTKLPFRNDQDTNYTLRLYGYTALGWQLIAEVTSYGNTSLIFIIILLIWVFVVNSAVMVTGYFALYKIILNH